MPIFMNSAEIRVRCGKFVLMILFQRQDRKNLPRHRDFRQRFEVPQAALHDSACPTSMSSPMGRRKNG
jgi:hypothetical protein